MQKDRITQSYVWNMKKDLSFLENSMYEDESFISLGILFQVIELWQAIDDLRIEEMDCSTNKSELTEARVAWQ